MKLLIKKTIELKRFNSKLKKEIKTYQHEAKAARHMRKVLTNFIKFNYAVLRAYISEKDTDESIFEELNRVQRNHLNLRMVELNQVKELEEKLKEKDEKIAFLYSQVNNAIDNSMSGGYIDYLKSKRNEIKC